MAIKNNSQEFLTFYGRKGDAALVLARPTGFFPALAIFFALWAQQAVAADGVPYVVVLKDSVEHPGGVARAQAEKHQGRVGFVYRHALKGYSVTMPQGQVDALRRNPRVDFVTFDSQAEAFAQTTPTGVKRVFAPNNALLDIDTVDDERADVDVAVIDTGIDGGQPDLSVASAVANCVPPKKFEEPTVEECSGGEAEDDVGHGTHVAGTIGAIDNGEGVVGVAPGARLWSVKVLTPNENGEGEGSQSWITAGVDWVTAHASAIEVANMSLGCGPDLVGKELVPCTMKAVETAVKGSMEKGIVYVVAAGNDNVKTETYVSPAKMTEVITVSAMADYDGKANGEAESLWRPSCKTTKQEGDVGKTWGDDEYRANFSNYGAVVDITAPGVCINSTLPNGKYGLDSGTSMAAPHVAGAAAILASISKPESLEDVKAIRGTIVAFANEGWTDNSGDGAFEELLDVSDEGPFNLNG